MAQKLFFNEFKDIGSELDEIINFNIKIKDLELQSTKINEEIDDIKDKKFGLILQCTNKINEYYEYFYLPNIKTLHSHYINNQSRYYID